ncbi:MAG: carbon-monoxide dehydrogenase accessory protein [Candidatus Methanoperedens nitroreducens]|uniref:Carbon-monoxide dehydrogenase accessory protein n=1 Tax=Candidatus Methanoperedens nitratireducens TaxID=1392998 RepID=A0A0P8DVN3_9EURY|nr:AAA family ATPase [Candidatus Methanoperedens sp. BLZ2]KAB2944507.1 MAG: AAA family ATPase [Candidatus Methanoperedens sp.]KPQ41599.1 MAG: carbon-monoxide dehydrogenase accessory protein [Candidatus Methanoperedens sp. BLZ1]MBZ0176293.1 AAA family ATPase [Candidatus Methanoperedens nitroreducens]CAG0989429.1 Septum site-determining protein MinD [Methanosarcinales archaeon]MCX9077226.1 AAA family ATPase [Candidatus Methanoperedens sp.]
MKVIAITGKGGTGKTAVAGMLIRHISKKNKTLLAIDADPDSNLPDVLGVKVEKTIGDMREFMLQQRDKLPPDTNKESLLESKVYEVLCEMPRYDLLVMGRPEGSGCYCFANNLLRGIMDKILKNYDVTIIDTAAGLEHLSRRIIRDVDELLVVTDGSRRGLQTAQRIRELAKSLDLKVKQMHVIANKVTPQNQAQIEEYARELKMDLVGVVPFDEMLAEFDLEGRPLAELPEDSRAIIATAEIAKKMGF